jgi:hypothetical protein
MLGQIIPYSHQLYKHPLIDPLLDLEKLLLHSQLMICDKTATVNQHPPVHHPLDACYYLVVREPQLSQYLVSPWESIL